jgi:FkbM family methyltransferase
MMKTFAMHAISRGLSIPHEPFERVDELSHLRNLIKTLDVDCVLDVGANIGQFAKEVRGIGYAGAIISFEPQASEFATLTSRFTRDVKWSGFQCALGTEQREAVINVPNKTVNASLLRIASGEQCRQETIQIRRLDSIPLPFSRIFLKMDTQGYDLQVFAGATGILDRVVGLQSELSIVPLYNGMPDYLDALMTYKQAGFQLHNLSVVNRVQGGGLLELNCFMRRRS